MTTTSATLLRTPPRSAPGLEPEHRLSGLEAIGPQTDDVNRRCPDLSEYVSLGDPRDDGEGFDDIILLDPRSASQVTEVARHIAFRGTLNLVGEYPLDGLSSIDFGRLHYDYTAFVGTRGPTIETAYGEQRNGCDLRPHGVAVFVGAGGPMGQMHVQRALEKADGPSVVIGIDPDRARLDVLAASLGPLAERSGCELIVLNADAVRPECARTDRRAFRRRRCDDVIVTVPVATVIASAAQLMSDDGMLCSSPESRNGTTGPST